MAYAINHISGCHLKLAVSIRLWSGGRFPANQLLLYIIAQVIGGIVADGALFVIVSGATGFDATADFVNPTDLVIIHWAATH